MAVKKVLIPVCLIVLDPNTSCYWHVLTSRSSTNVSFFFFVLLFIDVHRCHLIVIFFECHLLVLFIVEISGNKKESQQTLITFQPQCYHRVQRLLEVAISLKGVDLVKLYFIVYLQTMGTQKIITKKKKPTRQTESVVCFELID